MSNLTHEQIEAVVQWMNTWEQLKDTAIPMRFMEDWSNRIPHAEKPPIGLKPKWTHDKQRQEEIMGAMSRYLEAGKTPPKEWAIEFASYCE